MVQVVLEVGPAVLGVVQVVLEVGPEVPEAVPDVLKAVLEGLGEAVPEITEVKPVS